MDLSKVIGIFVIIAGVVLGLYVGIYLLFVGGILNLVSFAETNYQSINLLIKGIVKILIASPVGGIIFWVFSFIGGLIFTNKK